MKLRFWRKTDTVIRHPEVPFMLKIRKGKRRSEATFSTPGTMWEAIIYNKRGRASTETGAPTGEWLWLPGTSVYHENRQFALQAARDMLVNWINPGDYDWSPDQETVEIYQPEQ